MHASEVTQEVTRRANELYWHSDKSVNAIAEELDLSKGTLYEVVEPEGTGYGCPLCGDEVEYPNRTARDRGTVECPTCSWDGDMDETIRFDPDASGRTGQTQGAAALVTSETVDMVAGSAPDGAQGSAPPSLRRIAQGAAIGAAVGLALVYLARRR